MPKKKTAIPLLATRGWLQSKFHQTKLTCLHPGTIKPHGHCAINDSKKNKGGFPHHDHSP